MVVCAGGYGYGQARFLNVCRLHMTTWTDGAELRNRKAGCRFLAQKSLSFVEGGELGPCLVPQPKFFHPSH